MTISGFVAATELECFMSLDMLASVAHVEIRAAKVAFMEILEAVV